LIIEEELKKFSESFNQLETRNSFQKLNNLNEIFHKSFFEIVAVPWGPEEEEEGRDSQSILNKNIPETAEKFRYEKENSALTTLQKNRKSIDSSSILSNLSLQDVFNSTNKNLLDKNSHLFQEHMNMQIHMHNPNIILEEDSNFNMNTFNLKTNFNNIEFDYAAGGNDEVDLPNVHDDDNFNPNDVDKDAKDYLKLDEIQEEILKFFKR